MKLIRSLLFVLLLLTNLQSKEEALNVNFKNLEIMELIDITSKVINKNILITKEIKGKVDFISNKPVYRKDIINILIYVLESKGYTLIENQDILRIVKLTDTAKYNLPIIYGKTDKKYFHMITEVFHVKNINVDYIATKIRHLISKSAKLISDKESNSIVITDFEANIKTIKRVIDLISNDQKKTLEVIELKNIRSDTAKTILMNVAKALYNFQIKNQKMDILSNKGNNAITIVGNKKNVTYLINYITNLDDKGDLHQRVVDVIDLKNVESKNVIKVIHAIIEKKKYADLNSKPHASSDEDLNAIIVMGPKDEVYYIRELIKKLDKDKLQVYVEAKIIEVSENRTRNIGLKYGFSGVNSISNGIFSFGSNLGGTVSAVDSSLSSLINISKPTLSNGLALGATLNLLNQNQAIDIISEPSILCINNKESSIYVGETKSFKTGSTANSTGTTSSFSREDIGLTLKVKPRISNDNKVTLEINTILEDAKELTTGQTNPDTTKKEVKTSAIVTNGEAVIIGGLIRNKLDMVKHDIPFFSDIPILGNLFTNNRSVKDKINLIIIITPYIIPKSKDLSFIRNKLEELNKLEEKYTKVLIHNLEENKSKKDLKENQSISNDEKTLTNEALHQKRVKELFGL